ncbi:MAG TPA: cupin domain-containing protein [Chthoniobacterales bacterium]|nr:cupin domain-containing protein [Chthoniobacterales bacterium]
MSGAEHTIEPLPGGIGVTHLKVYESLAPDGLAGGSPHMHFACSEAYLVIRGAGSVQTLSSGGFRDIPLRPGSLVWFTPGVIHRLINGNGELEIFAVMENAGLPEHGDSVLTFPVRYFADEPTYRRAASLDPDESNGKSGVDAARKRRDLAVEGYHELRREFARGSLQVFYDQVVQLVRSKESDWRGLWGSGAARTILRTEGFLDKLRIGAGDYLNQGRVFQFPLKTIEGDRKLGMCGTLRPYLAEGALIV